MTLCRIMDDLEWLETAHEELIREIEKYLWLWAEFERRYPA